MSGVIHILNISGERINEFKLNSAYRVRSVLSQVKQLPDSTKIYDAWSELFDIEDDDLNRKTFAISNHLSELHGEVENIKLEMGKLEYSSSLYLPSMSKCNSVFAVHVLMNNWNAVNKNITDEVMTVLGFCEEILPSEEDLIDQDDLENLKEMADDLRATLSESKLPERALNLISKHLEKIESAIASYQVIGAKAFEETIKSAYGEVIANAEIFQEAKNSPELGKLASIWQKTKSILDGVVSTNKRLSGMQGVIDKGQKLVELIQNLNV